MPHRGTWLVIFSAGLGPFESLNTTSSTHAQNELNFGKKMKRLFEEGLPSLYVLFLILHYSRMNKAFLKLRSFPYGEDIPP